jgi:hypothetical protein
MTSAVTGTNSKTLHPAQARTTTPSTRLRTRTRGKQPPYRRVFRRLSGLRNKPNAARGRCGLRSSSCLPTRLAMGSAASNMDQRVWDVTHFTAGRQYFRPSRHDAVGRNMRPAGASARAEPAPDMIPGPFHLDTAENATNSEIRAGWPQISLNAGLPVPGLRDPFRLRI